jgi:AcrR family transcriptional regulator
VRSANSICVPIGVSMFAPNDTEWIKTGGRSPVAPFNKDPRKAAKSCFDRVTGKPVPANLLATYREALSGYHLHAEAKFLNAEPFDRGRTQRQPVRASGIELIGKEANRWEEQFFLGEEEDAQISYGLLPSSDDFHERLGGFVGRFGKSRVADVAGVSRPSLTRLFKKKTMLTKRMREKLEDGFTILAEIDARGRTKSDKVLQRLRQRAADEGVSQLASDLGVDRSNLSIELGRCVRIVLPQCVGHQSSRCIQPFTKIIEAFPRLCHGLAGLFNERADLCLLDRIRIIRIGDTDFDRVFVAAQPFGLLRSCRIR